MLFNSWGYIFIYLFLGIPLFWLCPQRLRVPFIVVASLAFYSMWRWEFSLLMVFAALVDFFVARRIYTSSSDLSRKYWLWVSIFINLGMLLFFKYTYFVYDNVRIVTSLFGLHLKSLQEVGVQIILPLGISFFTFQTLNYTIDVYRRVLVPTPHFSTFLAYVTFWPHLMAGPILRASEVIPQLENERRRRFDRTAWFDITQGLQLVCSGLFKKVVIADNLAPKVDAAFALNSNLLSGLDVWVAAFLFGFQIYFDFAGYSDIAIGSARMLGVKIPDNFNWPYLATSPRDFWKRWHISLSEWIRDYLYLPLTGQKFVRHEDGQSKGLAVAVDEKNSGSQTTSAKNRDRALFATWFIMGLWHGAGWNFVIWGLYHAGLIYLYRSIRPLKNLENNYPWLARTLMLPLIMLGWIPFRSESVTKTFEMFSIALNPMRYSLTHRVVQYYAYPSVMVLIFASWACFIIWSKTSYASQRDLPPRSRELVATVFLMAVEVMLVIAYLRPVRQFIYFQF